MVTRWSGRQRKIGVSGGRTIVPLRIENVEEKREYSLTTERIVKFLFFIKQQLYFFKPNGKLKGTLRLNRPFLLQNQPFRLYL